MAVTTTTAPQVIINRMTKQQYDSATKSATEFYVITDVDEYVTTTTNQDVDGAKKFLDPVTIQNGAGTGSLIVGGDVNDDTLTNNTRKLGRINSPSYASGSTPTATLLGWDTSGDSDMHTINNDKDAVCFGGMKKITTNTSPLNIVFCVANARGATAEENKVYALELDANQARFNVQPNYNGNNLLTSADLPTKISDLTDDTATSPIDQADTLTGLTASVSELNILDGATLSTTELNYVDGVTSSIQTQLDNKVTKNADITGATKCKITYDSKGLVTGGADLQASDIPSLTLSKISDVTASATEVNVLDGITATTTELNYVDGVTSSIQTQLNNKQATITGAATTITSSDLTASRALVSNSSGKVAVSNVTATELGYLDGVTSAIQTQLNNKVNIKPDGTNDLITNNKVADTYLPDYLFGQMIYAGGFVPNTAVATLTANAKKKLGTQSNTITLTNDTTPITGYVANEGCYYICTADGTFAGVSLLTGDWLVSTGSAWTKVDNTDAVTGVKGNAETTYRLGNVNITIDNVAPDQTSNNGKFLKTDGTNASWNSLTVSDISDITASASELNILDGVTATTTELNYVDGVTSNIQTQLNAKATDTDVVHTSGNESITGKKTFSDILVANGDDNYYLNLKATNLANNNTTPTVSSLREFRISANDSSIICGYRAAMTTSGKTQNRIYARRYIDGSNKEAYITLEVDSNGVGTVVTMQPTQDTTSSSQIDTVGARNTKLQNYQTTITGAATTITSSDLTASKALISNSSGKVAVSTVTDTELGYVSGVTSNIQTQLDSKQATLVSGTNIKTINNNSIIGSGNLSLDTIPTQTGNSGKVLTTNGTTASWGYAAIMREWVD